MHESVTVGISPPKRRDERIDSLDLGLKSLKSSESFVGGK